MTSALQRFFVVAVVFTVSAGCAMTREARLIWNAQNGKTEYVRGILQEGTDVNSRYRDTTALWAAARNGHTDTVRLLLEKGANIEAKTDTGLTPLMSAAEFKHDDIVRILLETGADVNAKDSYGMTALFFAVIGSDVETVKQLLGKRAEVNVIANQGLTPLKTARKFGKKDIEQILLEAGARE
jgi:ankyrin repeat protein